jgi:E3 ubiquitin-protein ligase HERC2
MADLLAFSLMADGGLEFALKTAIKAEISELLDDRKDIVTSGLNHLSKDYNAGDTKSAFNGHNTHNAHNAATISLLQLVKQLVCNGTCITQSRLRALQHQHQQQPRHQDPQKKIDNSPSLKLLLRFQRLLIAQMLNCIGKCGSGSEPQDQEMLGVESLLHKYIRQVCSHVVAIMPIAMELINISGKHFVMVSSVLKTDIISILLPELVICLILLQVRFRLSRPRATP